MLVFLLLWIQHTGGKEGKSNNPHPSDKTFLIQNQFWGILFHTTRREDVKLTAVKGSEARKPLAFSKALNRLVPEIQKTKGNSWHLLAKEQKASYFSSVMNL